MLATIDDRPAARGCRIAPHSEMIDLVDCGDVALEFQSCPRLCVDVSVTVYPSLHRHVRSRVDLQMHVVENRELEDWNGCELNILLNGTDDVTPGLKLPGVGSNLVGGRITQKAL